MNAKVIYLQTEEKNTIPRLSVFFTYKNKNGQCDFSKFKIIHKETGITWNVDGKTLNFFQDNSLKENEFLAGTNKLAFPADKILQGKYIMSIYKLNMESTSKNVLVRSPKLTSPIFPVRVSMEEKKAKLQSTSTISKCSVILLAADMQPFYATDLNQNDFSQIDLSTLLDEKKDAHYVQFLFSIDENDFLTEALKI